MKLIHSIVFLVSVLASGLSFAAEQRGSYSVSDVYQATAGSGLKGNFIPSTASGPATHGTQLKDATCNVWTTCANGAQISCSAWGSSSCTWSYTAGESVFCEGFGTDGSYSWYSNSCN